MRAADRALALVQDGMVLGLGTGRAATTFLHSLGRRVRAGLRIRGVPTSLATAQLATQLGIPLTTLAEVPELDLAVDGADEVDPHLHLIKGLGGALVREKIVAASARRLVILVGPEKVVPVLGSRGVLPVEVVPFGAVLCRRRLEQLGCPAELRQVNGHPFVSDNQNYILDCQIRPLQAPAELERQIQAIPGVVGTGLFLGMAHTVLVDDGVHVRVLERSPTSQQ